MMNHLQITRHHGQFLSHISKIEHPKRHHVQNNTHITTGKLNTIFLKSTDTSPIAQNGVRDGRVSIQL